jgi:flagellar FliL protein
MAENTEMEGKGFLRSKKSKFLILPILLLLLTAVALITFFFFYQGAWASLMGEEQQVEDTNASDSQAEKKSLGPTIKLDNFVVNINDGERTRYLKTGITLEAMDKKTKKEIKNRKPQIRDAVIFLSSNKNFRELRDLQGKRQLQADIQHKINSILRQGKVRRIFFTEFVVQ